MIRLFIFLYQQLLQVYPRSFRAEFGAEMEAVYDDLLADARRQGIMAVVSLVCRELAHAPGAILRAHCWACMHTAQRTGRSPWGVLLLPEIDPQVVERDGRHSRLQAALELLPFVLSGALLLLLTYAENPGAQPGLQRQLEPLRAMAIFLATPASLLGLARGLPRWTYPWLGFLAGYSAFVAHHLHMLWFFAATLLAVLALALAAAILHARTRPLPLSLRWMARSLQVDWTRASFAVLGALPLVILVAFDDGYLNSHTLWLALATLPMVVGATLYSRSRGRAMQITVLLGAVSLSLVCALVNHAQFRGGLLGWKASSGSLLGDIDWLLGLWFGMLLLAATPQYAGPWLVSVVRRIAAR